MNCSSLPKKTTNFKERSGRSLGLYQNVIEATDKGTGLTAEWVSRENLYLKGFYQFASGSWWLGASGEFHVQKYEEDLSPTFTWDKDDPRLFKLSLLADYERKRWSAGLGLDYNQEVFIYEENQEISLNEIFMLGVSLRSKYKWLTRKPWTSSVGVSISYPFKGSDELEPEGLLGYLIFIDLKRDKAFGPYSLSSKIFYGAREFENIQNEQEERFVGFEIGITWNEKK